MRRQHSEIPIERANLWSLLGHGRSPLSWMAALAIAALMALAAKFSLDEFLGTMRPSVAQQIDAQLIAQAATSAPQMDPDGQAAVALIQPRPSSRTVRQAREQLRKEPLDATILRQLAFAQPATSTPEEFRRLIDLSTSVSRRDGLMQLWLIFSAANDRDGDAIMRHIDLLLRTHPSTAPLIFKALSGALADPALREILRVKFADNPPWLSDFLIYAIPQVQQPELIADVLSGFKVLPRSTDFDSAWFQLLNKLADNGRPRELREVYLRIPGAEASLLSSVAPPASEAQSTLAPVSWHLIENSDFAATLVALTGTRGDAFEVYVSDGQSGVVARKVVYLGPGIYRFSVTLLPDSGQPSVRMTARCLGTGAIIGSTSLAPVVRERRQLEFTMRDGCQAALLQIEAATGIGQSDGVFVVHSFSLGR